MKPILQVDDDPNDVFLLQRAMKKAGVVNPIQVATDGQQAIDYLKGAGKFADRKQFPLPCLVLLDLKLPYVMGLEVLAWIRQQPGAGLIVIVLTASGQEAEIASAYRLGANAFLTKPSEASKLVDMVKAIKDFWLTHNMPPQESLNGFRSRSLNGSVAQRKASVEANGKPELRQKREQGAGGQAATNTVKKVQKKSRRRRRTRHRNPPRS
jgi:two-component system response regulator